MDDNYLKHITQMRSFVLTETTSMTIVNFAKSGYRVGDVASMQCAFVFA